MGKDRWEEQARKGASKPNGKRYGVNNEANQLISLHPTKEEARELEKLSADIAANLSTIGDYIDSGCKLYWGLSAQTNSPYLILRAPEIGGDPVPSLAVFHTDPAKIMAGLAFMLTVKHKNWPIEVTGQLDFKPEW